MTTEDRLINKLHILRSGTKDCAVCSYRKIQGEKKTRLYFKTCESKPGIHIGDCYVKYHKIKKNFK